MYNISLLKQYDIQNIQPIKSHGRSSIYTGTYNGTKKFIKLSENPEKFYTVRSQYEFNTFTNTYFGKLESIVIPHAEIIETPKYVLGLFDYFEAPAFAETDPFIIKSLPNEKQTQQILNFCAHLDSIPQKNIPQYFIGRKLSHEDYLNKMSNYVEPILGNVIGKTQFKKMQELFMNTQLEFRLNHHDFILWNMLNADDSIILVDAEHSRYGMRWYDISYFILQTYISLGEKNYAQNFLRLTLEKFSNIQFAQAMLQPSIYRLSAKLPEFKNSPMHLERTHEFIEIILNEDITKFLEL